MRWRVSIGLVLTALVVVMMSGRAMAVECDTRDVEGKSYAICAVDVRKETLRLFLYDDHDVPYGSFFAVDNALKPLGQSLQFAMNAGMYHDDRSPVGHYRENGTEKMRVIANAGPGNFGLLPNGVFCIAPGRAEVIETTAYLKRDAAECPNATQSGPMLVIDGKLHPRFLADGTSRYIRNGVGVSAGGNTAYFAISNDPVTFHEFGRLFRDLLKTPQALYFDGNISRLYAPQIRRSDLGRRLGPIVGVVAPVAPVAVSGN
jgi:uncharacterized protein YigE (DUF2233 family)